MSTTATVASAAKSSSKPVSGGTMTILHQVDVRSLDAAKMSGGSIDGMWGQMIYDQLQYSDAATGKITPGTALSVTGDSTGTVWTIKLRPGVKFTDGTPYDAAAVMAHIQRQANPATASPARAAAAEVASMQVVDPTTLKVTLSAPNGLWDFYTYASAITFVESPTAVAKDPTLYGTAPDKIVGAGPFTVKEYIVGDHTTLAKNPTYYEKGKPYLDSIIIKGGLAADVKYNLLSTGGADIENLSTPDPTLPQLIAGYPYKSWKGSISTIAINTKEGPTADLRVRQALVYAIDWKAVIARSAPGAEQVLTYAPKGSPYYNGVKVPPYDLDKAKKAMASYLQETGQTSVTIPLDIANTTATVGTAMKQEWDKVPGLNVVVQVGTSASTSAQIGARNYKGLLNSGLTVLPIAAKTTLLSTSPQNLTFVNDPIIDAAVTKAVASTDLKTQTAQLKIVTEQLNEQLPYIVEFFSPFAFFHQKTVQDLQVGFAIMSLRSQDLWSSKKS